MTESVKDVKKRYTKFLNEILDDLEDALYDCSESNSWRVVDKIKKFLMEGK